MTMPVSSSSFWMISVIIYTAAFTEPAPEDKPDKPTVTRRSASFAHRASFLTASPRFSSHSREAGLERYAIAGKESDWTTPSPAARFQGMLSVKRKHGADADAATPEKKSSRRQEGGQGSQEQGKDAEVELQEEQTQGERTAAV